MFPHRQPYKRFHNRFAHLCSENKYCNLLFFILQLYLLVLKIN
jgi:hypothetical protein